MVMIHSVQWKWWHMAALSALTILLITNIPDRDAVPTPERSICFILGEDRVGQHFYTLAEEYFSTDAEARVDHMVMHVRSIEELIRHLNQHSPDPPWTRIELVVHGNVWSGLSLKITDGGERAYPKELCRAVMKNELPKLSRDIISSQTIINVWACGIGTNPIMNTALSLCFTDAEGTTAQIKASKKFVVFKRDQTGMVRLLQASYWPYFFKRGYRPSDTTIAETMAREYPEAVIDFSTAVGQKSDLETPVFEESFHIPVSWTVIYDHADQRPPVQSDEDKMTWIKSQPGLMKKIKELSIPISQYHWTVNQIQYLNDQGQRVPAIKAIGMSTVVCVLQT